MKIIYCPPGEDPMKLARAAQKKRAGGGGALAENWWVILAVVAFAVIGVTVGPFKGLLQKPVADTAAAPEAVTAPLPTPAAPPIFCQNPGGGLVGEGDTAWVDHTTEVTLYQCTGGELVKLQVITQTVSLAP